MYCLNINTSYVVKCRLSSVILNGRDILVSAEANLCLLEKTLLLLNWLDTITIFQAQMFPKLLQAPRRDIKQKDGHKVRLLNRCLLVAPGRFRCPESLPGAAAVTYRYFLPSHPTLLRNTYTCGLNKDHCLKLGWVITRFKYIAGRILRVSTSVFRLELSCKLSVRSAKRRPEAGAVSL